MPNDKYADRRYEFYKRVYSSERLVKVLKICDILAVASVVCIFVFCAVKMFLMSLLNGALFLILAAVPFVMVSALRVIVSLPRPYELYDFSEFTSRMPHYKSGRSFPSRHVFSAFLIGTLVLGFVPFLGITALVAGVILSVLRSVLGIHYVKDVVAGVVIGVASGLVGMLVL